MRVPEAEAAARQALAFARRSPFPGDESWALTELARAARHRGDLAEAASLAREALAAARRDGSQVRAALALRELAALPAPPSEQTAWLTEVARIGRTVGDPMLEGDAACALLVAEHQRYRAGNAEALEEWLRTWRRIDDRLRVATTSLYLGIVRTARLELGAAEVALRDALAVGGRSVTVPATWRLAAVHLLRGAIDDAEALLEPVRASGLAGVPGAQVRILTGRIRAQRGEASAARAIWQEVAGAASSGPGAQAEALVLLGRQAERSDPGSAAILLQDALRISTEGGLAHLECRAAARLAVLAAARGDGDEGEAWLERAAAQARALGTAWPAHDHALAEAEVAWIRGDPERARAALDRSDRICAGSHPGHEQAEREELRERLRR